MQSKWIAQVGHQCVACGTCLKVCPMSAIAITDGLYAKIDLSRCVGCSKCEKICPASVITIIPREVSA